MKVIIMPGHYHSYETTCPDCGCMFYYDEEDIETAGLNDFVFYVSCPDCNYPVGHIV